MATNPFALLAGQPGPAMPAAAPTDFNALSAPPTQLPQPAGPAAPSVVSFVRDTAQVAPQAVEQAIDKLRPDSELLKKTVAKLDAMFKFSRDAMSKHYFRWNLNEQKVQAYVHCTDYERVVKSLEGQRGATPPQPTNVIVPYTYATLHAAATFVTSVLLGRKPIFPLLAVRGTQAEQARMMEMAIQSNLDASRGYETLWQMCWDSLLYGFGVTRNAWEERTGPAVRFIGGQREMVTETTFAGNSISAVDPYSFFPDPRVPIHQCNTRGDFMFTEMEQSETVLRDMERAGSLKWVREGLDKSRQLTPQQPAVMSRRTLRIGGRAEYLRAPSGVIGFRTVREGTVRLVPKDWGLGPSTQSEIWKFTWLENSQVIQAEPLGMVHGQHPYSATEPTSFGYDFMSLSMNDMIGPFQDILSWLVSSRMENVRASINNQFVADPSRVEINDIRSSAIGRIIRLKQAAMGLPVGEAIQQLVVQDVTQGHLADIQTMRILADTITGVNDNMRGIQTAGGRRSATEARMSMQAGGSRLSQLAIRISSQGFMPMVEQMILNIQQFMPDTMWMEVTGDDGQPSSRQLTPDMLVGSFNYQVSDGTLPFDKTALVEVWKEILFGIAQDPELRQTYSLPQIFRYVAELGGAKNIDSFKRAPMQPGQLPMQAGAGANPAADPNMQPIGAAMPSGPMLGSQFQP